MDADSESRARPGPGGRASSGLSRRTIAFFFLLLLLNYWIVSSLVSHGPQRVRIPYSPTFLGQVRAGNVASITSKGTAVQGAFKHPVHYPAGTSAAASEFATELPQFANSDALDTLLEQKHVVVNATALQTGTSVWVSLLFSFGPILLLVGLWVWFLRRSAGAGGGGGIFSFGRAKPRLYEPAAEHVSFDDVAGIDEARDELTEVVDFLRDPAKYRRLGARIPRGVLLTGPPGTGKTLLARAVAGEAGVHFFSMSASEFVEMIVGVGASRVRDLFVQAKAAAPSIVFIDEIDAIGRSRGAGIAGFSGANDEREQTLNQVLTEMDGFDPSTGVIVLAATNRPDVLDPALLRPGRFDRRVVIQPPDKQGRLAILRVHTRSLPLAPDVALDVLAASTVGMVGADLANLANEAALLAARRVHDRVRMADFTDSLEKLVLGAERKIVLGPLDRRRTAYHEAGHAIVGMLTPGADPVRKISIIPRGIALGVTFAAPETDRFSYEESYLRARIKVALGGRVADELVFGEATSGAEGDILQATEVARDMVGRWGMSSAVGFVSVLPSERQAALYPGYSEASDHTRRVVDDEVRRIMDASHDEVAALLAENRDKLDALAGALILRETLDEADAYAAAGVELPHEGQSEAELAPNPARAR